MIARFRSLHLMLLASTAGALALAPTPAAAQQPPAPPGESAEPADQEEIVITAAKREEPILDIPQSVSVVTGATLERQQATDFEDFAALVPGLSINQTNPGNSRVILRGVNTGGVGATVGIYVDETPFGSSSGLANGSILAGDFDTFDVSRLEVLRGPQGTLYGASALGGVIKYVTVAPQLGKFEGRVRGGLESIKSGGIGWNATGMVNLPLGEKAAIRASGYYRRNPGWIDGFEDNVFIGSSGSIGGEDINDGDIFGGRASLLFRPVDALNIRLTAIHQTIDIGDNSLVDVSAGSQNPVGGGLKQTRFIPEDRRTRYRVYNGTVDYDFGFATLLSSTSFARLKQDFFVDNTLAFGNLVTLFFGDFATRPLGVRTDQVTSFKRFTQELRLTSPSNDRFEWMIGGYYNRERGLIDQSLDNFDLLQGNIAADVPATTAELPSKFREIAGFANATLHLGDRFDITAGGRWSRNKQSASQVLEGPLVGGGPIVFANRGSSESVFTYSIAPRFELNETSALYARVATGYRPGGPNLLAPGVPADTPATYASDRITSYEAGLKTDVGRRLSLDVSLFLLKWTDIQLFTVINNVGLNANGGKATSKGIEGSVNWRPVRGLSLLGTATLTDAELDNDAPAAGGFKGDWLPWVPRATLGLSADYEWPLRSNATAFVGASGRYVGRQSADFDAAYVAANGGQRRIDSYGVLDLRAGVDFSRFTVEAYVKNLTNSRGLVSAFQVEDVLFGPALPNGDFSAGIIQPRTIGLSVSANF